MIDNSKLLKYIAIPIVAFSLLFGIIGGIGFLYNKNDMKNFKYYIYKKSNNKFERPLITSRKKQIHLLIDNYKGEPIIFDSSTRTIGITGRAKIIDTIGGEVVKIRLCFHCEDGSQFSRAFTHISNIHEIPPR